MRKISDTDELASVGVALLLLVIIAVAMLLTGCVCYSDFSDDSMPNISPRAERTWSTNCEPLWGPVVTNTPICDGFQSSK